MRGWYILQNSKLDGEESRVPSAVSGILRVFVDPDGQIQLIVELSLVES